MVQIPVVGWFYGVPWVSEGTMAPLWYIPVVNHANITVMSDIGLVSDSARDSLPVGVL